MLLIISTIIMFLFQVSNATPNRPPGEPTPWDGNVGSGGVLGYFTVGAIALIIVALGLAFIFLRKNKVTDVGTPPVYPKTHQGGEGPPTTPPTA